MAEAAGLVLGGIPIVIWATEKYREPVKTFFKYGKVLTTFQNDLILQQEQLHATLRTIGITTFPPAPGELEARIRHISPVQNDAFTQIIGEMSEIIEKLMQKLNVAIDGKPDWTTDPPERAKWEWGRVKRSLGSKERRDIIDDLQRRNIALRNCFEQQELSSVAAPTFAIGALQKQFSLDLCNTIRDHAAAIHRALRCGWNCSCPLSHQATFDLQWHSNRGTIQGDQRFNLTLSYPPNGPCKDHDTCTDRWHKTNMWVVEEQVVLPSLKVDENLASNPQCQIPSGGKAHTKRLRFKLSSPVPAPLEPLKPGEPPTANASTSNVCINNLCMLIAEKHASSLDGYLQDPDTSQRKRRIFLSSVRKARRSPGGRELISLRSLLASSRVSRPLKLSRKQRLSIAAAMAWAVLHLSGSPWLAETWQKDEVHFFLENSSPQELLATTPCISYSFHETQLKENGGSNGGSDSENPLVNLLQYKLVRNRTLFALGIFLIEVGFNTPFEELRRQRLVDACTSSVVEDYQLAVDLADDLHLDAGPEYGDAIKRCLRCEFPGRDVTKHFGYAPFRQEFFNGVVAPVQATYDCYSL